MEYSNHLPEYWKNDVQSNFQSQTFKILTLWGSNCLTVGNGPHRPKLNSWALIRLVNWTLKVNKIAANIFIFDTLTHSAQLTVRMTHDSIEFSLRTGASTTKYETRARFKHQSPTLKYVWFFVLFYVNHNCFQDEDDHQFIRLQFLALYFSTFLCSH